MKGIFKVKELNEKFTEVTNKYLAQGMKFNVGTMAGHQGEIAKIDLTDGKDVYRIAMDSKSVHPEDWKYTFDAVIITVEKFEDADDSTMLRPFDTLWSGRGQQVEQYTWYRIGYREDGAYTDDYDFAKECLDLQRERAHARQRANYNPWIEATQQEITMDDQRRTFVRDICKRTRGYGSIKNADIKKLTKYSDRFGHSYMVSFNNGKRDLTIKKVVA